MKGSNLILGAAILAVSTMVHAASYYGSVASELSYTLTTPSGSVSTQEYPSPITGIGHLSINLNPGQVSFGGTFDTGYHVVEFGSGGSFATGSYALTQYINPFTVGVSFDPATRHLTGFSYGSGSQFFAGTSCVSPTPANCATLGGEFYSVPTKVPTSAVIDLYFNYSLNAITSGTVTLNTLYANGTVLTRTYGVETVPVPMAGVLFGSALLGLAGVSRRKR